MSVFICEKCGYISNSALRGTFHHASANLSRIRKNEPIDVMYAPEFEFFETHRCCDKCADGVRYSDNSGTLHPNQFTFAENELYHWTDYSKEKLLELEKLNNGSMANASYFFDNGFDKTVSAKGEASWQTHADI